MASGIVLSVHLIFLIYIFVIKKKRESISSAYQNALLIIVLFTAAWAIITMLVNIVVEPQGFGEEFDRDGISLVVVSVVEFLFYRKYYGPEFTTGGGKEKQ